MTPLARATAVLALLPLVALSLDAANRLADAASPYLRQHADNPVNWHPWGDEAFEKARQENKPIFLSSGYSTCHWCHVMNRESFSDPAVAAFINEHFIAIKLDREERPDIDRIYLAFVSATTGQGGWPLNVWLTPDLRPFLGGTYFPPVARDGAPAFIDVAKAVAHGWTEQRDQVVAHADRITAALRQSAATASAADAALPGRAEWEAAFAQLAVLHDSEHGGFGRGAKFPDASRIHFLLRHAVDSGTPAEASTQSRSIALAALDAILDGEVHDVIGGGFHRYAENRDWSTPHYEKMLYDQGLVTLALLDAYQLTGEARWADAARSALAFVQRELTSPQGAFHSALDAESLPDAEASKPIEGADYAATAEERAAARRDLEARAALLATRTQRPRPHRDDKHVAAWNGYAISAFARAYQVLGERAYLVAATRATHHLRRVSYDADSGRLSRVPGQAAGFAEDYASLIQASLDLYEAGFDPQWLDWALALQRAQNTRFWDDAQGGYFNTAADDATVLVRLKEDFDDAEPAANSLSVRNLLRLSAFTGDNAHAGRARRALSAFAPQIASAPASLPVLLAASQGASGKARQIVIAGPLNDAATHALLAEARRPFQPHATFMLANGASGVWLARRLEVVAAMAPIDGRAAAYVCENYVCAAPVSTPAELARLLGSPVTP